MLTALALLLPALLSGQQSGTPTRLHEHAAIQYSTRPTSDAIATLNAQLDAGKGELRFTPSSGYLKSVLELLHVPIDSQVVVFSQTSVQSDLITPKNPRAIYFSDQTAVGWVRGADVLELATEDKAQGTIFYTLRQEVGARPRFERSNDCLLCHLSPDTGNVPGFLMFSVFSVPTDKYSYATGAAVDHRTAFHERWGGWYVTGRSAGRHLGNILDLRGLDDAAKRPVRQLDSLASEFDTTAYPTGSSDIVALMVLEHQARMTDMLTRMGWMARIASRPSAPGLRRPGTGAKQDAAAIGQDDLKEFATELVDYLLFIDESPLPGPIRGSSNFAQRFSSEGPRDRRGRSLRQLDLTHRLMMYPCSYMVYSDTFEALPKEAKEAVYGRLWRVLSGQEAGGPYTRLSQADRRAVIEILTDTKTDLPGYFHR
jgi:hypothetical protein